MRKNDPTMRTVETQVKLLYPILDELNRRIVQQNELSVPEAQVYYENLTELYKLAIRIDCGIDKTTDEFDEHDREINILRNYIMKITDLQVKLKKIISPIVPAPSTEPEVNDPSPSTNQITQLETTYNNLDVVIEKQKYLIKQIESLQITDALDAARAGILKSYLTKLYNTFISNQREIKLSVGATINNQQKITTQIQHKVFDFQTKLQKIITPTEPNYNQNQIITALPLVPSKSTVFTVPTSTIAQQRINEQSILIQGAIPQHGTPIPTVSSVNETLTNQKSLPENEIKRKRI